MIDAVIRSLRLNRFLRFLVAGTLNTLLGFAVYSAAILSGAPIWLALMIGLVAGVAFNFVSTGGYVFRDTALVRLPRFVFCYLLVYGVNLQLLGWLSGWIRGDLLPQAILSFPMAAFSYLLMARIVFAKPAPVQGSEKG
jgi:putative flippase GtrA